MQNLEADWLYEHIEALRKRVRFAMDEPVQALSECREYLDLCMEADTYRNHRLRRQPETVAPPPSQRDRRVKTVTVRVPASSTVVIIAKR